VVKPVLMGAVAAAGFSVRAGAIQAALEAVRRFPISLGALASSAATAGSVAVVVAATALAVVVEGIAEVVPALEAPPLASAAAAAPSTRVRTRSW
jgi:hypothetical protein